MEPALNTSILQRPQSLENDVTSVKQNVCYTRPRDQGSVEPSCKFGRVFRYIPRADFG
ncbi:hypothetical protein CY34DRAFT_407463 [Suillus luteus UH-Slu-Lm8-n1]|uniref:Uncharacterized protein n=1 Tax=Suillus luteus UH-Slu-Lm8-n1 TaxID=930992 RepID=A0A0C9ZKV8_9AGAM|nr:hypothetical protein CY34DRAFT_407463 [Suillus luteus UH-Slu-Lm8-n1]